MFSPKRSTLTITNYDVIAVIFVCTRLKNVFSSAVTVLHGCVIRSIGHFILGTPDDRGACDSCTDENRNVYGNNKLVWRSQNRLDAFGARKRFAFEIQCASNEY